MLSRPDRPMIGTSLSAAVERLEGRTLLSGSPPIDPLQVLIGEGAARSVTFTAANGTQGTVIVQGPGAANVVFNGSNLTQSPSAKGVVIGGVNVTIGSITTMNTTPASTLRVFTKGRGGPVSCGPITSNGALAAIAAAGVNVVGNVSSAGSIGQIQLASIQGGTITVGPSHFGAGTLALSLGSATDVSVRSAVPVTSINAASWTNSLPATQTIQSSRIGSVNVKGAFSPGIAVSTGASAIPALGRFAAGSITGGTWNIVGNTGPIRAGSITGWNATFGGAVSSIDVVHDASLNLSAGTINTFNVRGTLAGSSVQLVSPLAARGFDLGNFVVGGAVVSTTVRSAGSIGSVAAASMTNSRFYAGLANLPSGQPLPMAAGDFANVAEIRSITLRRSASASFAGSDIAAYALGPINLGTVTMANAGTPFGLAGHTIKSIALVDQATGKAIREPNVPSTAQFAGLLAAKGIAQQDFVVSII